MQAKGIEIISTYRKFQKKNVIMHRPSIKKSLAKVAVNSHLGYKSNPRKF